MGNSSTKESREGEDSLRRHRSTLGSALDSGLTTTVSSGESSRRTRVSRGDLGGFLGLTSGAGSSSNLDQPHERRETRQEREARRAERERVNRVKERERSLKEEHVDGGYLVTLGTYVGPEDYNKSIVRQLQIDRKLAPFWRGVEEIEADWAEPQIIAAARGLGIPSPDETPSEDLIPRPTRSDWQASRSRHDSRLTVPLGDRTLSADSIRSGTSDSGPSRLSVQASKISPPFQPRSKALAAVLGAGARNGSATDIVPREVNLPNDPFVNGQPLEVFLYKNAAECPICFLMYPPYLNRTRCCDQAICSECFVQIKRPDPHFPDGHNENDAHRNPEEAAGLLVSEPACCPYCTQPDFGVVYDPPPFRRGLAHSTASLSVGNLYAAMSSSSSVASSAPSPTLAPVSKQGSRRRTQSLSATAPNVITTDRVRPEWATKLQAARAHQARRAAAATALHTAAFLMGSGESRPFRVGRFGRRLAGGSSSASGNMAAANGGGGNGDTAVNGAETDSRGSSRRAIMSSSSREARTSRMEDLEDMMLMEAIRLSLAEEEERKRKAEKEERRKEAKEAKKKEKEERKAAKAAAKNAGGPYEGGRSGFSSAATSSLSLPGLGFGRKRVDSTTNQRVDASVANAVTCTGIRADFGGKDKGKSVDQHSSISPEEQAAEGTKADKANKAEKAEKAEKAGKTDKTDKDPSSLGMSPTVHAMSTSRPGPSHLFDMSDESFTTSNMADSYDVNHTGPNKLQDALVSGHGPGSHLGASKDGGKKEQEDSSTSTEPLFNLRSPAEVVGVRLEGENAGRRGTDPPTDPPTDPTTDSTKYSTIILATELSDADAGESGKASSLMPKSVLSSNSPHPDRDPAVIEHSEPLPYQTTTVDRHEVTQ